MPKKPAKTSAAPAKQSPELALINSIADILNKTGMGEIELEQKGVRVRVSKGGMAVSHGFAPQTHHAAPSAAPVAHQVAASAPMAPVAAVADSPGAVKSPMVGTVYLASAPGSPNFVSIGSQVKQGQTLLIIEAMKTMNQIPAPKSGTVTNIMVENGQPVEFGEAMMVIE
jgi:acetyl-CoA carboxylase biotin carboxyl carrier protein